MKKAFLIAMPTSIISGILIYILFGILSTPSWLSGDELKNLSVEYPEIFEGYVKIRMMLSIFGGSLAFIWMFFNVKFLEN